jgi:lipoprotein-anchoring transpeptidase ErfK/SrfK
VVVPGVDSRSIGRLLAAVAVAVMLVAFGPPAPAAGQVAPAPPGAEVAPAPVLDPVPVAKRIVVSLGQQYLWAYEGDVAVWESYVSTGKPGFETPLGVFSIGTKLETDRMAGTIGGETYDIPDVPDVMYFTDRGHAIHGTYWHANFGAPMSHGCVNLPLDLADWLFAWAPVGTPVEIVP